MRTFKLIDFWGQAILISGTVLAALQETRWLFYGYFLVGGWQLASCLVHALQKDRFFAHKSRKYYLQTLLWVFLLGIPAIPVWLFYGFALLIISPGLAAWYASICYSENQLLREKAFVHLK
jgi:hypothetical protein